MTQATPATHPISERAIAPSADGCWHNLCLAPGLFEMTEGDEGDESQALVTEGTLACIVVQQGRVVWVGAQEALPEQYLDLVTHDGLGQLATPGLIDCHTHLVYGGERANEFAMRLAGATYEEVAKAGGGIVSSVKATREASEDELVALARQVADDPLGVGPFGHVSHIGGLHLGAQCGFYRLPARLVLADPAGVGDGGDIHEPNLQGGHRWCGRRLCMGRKRGNQTASGRECGCEVFVHGGPLHGPGMEKSGASGQRRG